MLPGQQSSCVMLPGQQSSETQDMHLNHEATAECFARFSSGLLTSQVPLYM